MSNKAARAGHKNPGLIGHEKLQSAIFAWRIMPFYRTVLTASKLTSRFKTANCYRRCPCVCKPLHSCGMVIGTKELFTRVLSAVG